MLSEPRVGVCFLSVLPVPELIRLAKIADDAGLDSIWIGEGYQFFRRLHGEARSATTTAAESPATIGLRLTHRTIRSPVPKRRASIGSSSCQRRRSSANS